MQTGQINHPNNLSNDNKLPKCFYPLNYDLNIYLDIKNLRYEILGILEMNPINPNTKVLILNANLSQYEIKSLELSKYDLISDTFSERLKLNFYSNQIIKSISEKLKNNYCNMIKGNQEISNFTHYDKRYKFLDYLKEINIDDEEIEIFMMDIFDFISYFEDLTHLNIIDQTIYIPLDLEILNHDRFKLYFLVEGHICLSSEKNVGLYLSIFGKDADLLSDKEEFLDIWRDDSRNENLLKNAVICALNEPVECRTYMPCFDEICFKSKYNIKIRLDKKYVKLTNHFKALSNGEVCDILFDCSSEIFTYIFTESPLMSINLLTFIVGNFQYLESILGETKLRVFTPLGFINDGSFALEIVKKSLKFYQNYFKIPYSFGKIDLVPVADYHFGALENLGCIVFINYALMANKFLGIKERKNIARITCHEISHMWFGNLVSIEWWDDIWLNEGFARFMEFVCLDEIKPEFKIWEKFIELVFQNALDIDEMEGTHPVRGEIRYPSGIMNIFDTISYSKAASIIRMLNFFVNKDKFRRSINIYLEKYKNQNTKTKYLWEIFKEVTKVDLDPIMDTWLSYSGHPALRANLIEESGIEYLVLIQYPYPKNLNSCTNPIWKIPLFIKTIDDEYILLMEETELKINIQTTLKTSIIDLKTNKNFIKINSDMKGFYRVFYDSILFENLLDNIKKLSNIDIVGLLSDYFSSNDIKSCIKILNSIKPINNYLLLNYAMKIYHHFKEFCFQYSGFEDELQEYDDLKIEKEHKDIRHKVNDYFAGLINLGLDVDDGGVNFRDDKKEIINKIYLKDQSCYLNESDDEFQELVLYIYLFIKNDEEIITHIVENFEKNYQRMHKNFKYIVYSVMTNYSHKIQNISNRRQIEIYEVIYNEYINSFHYLSTQEKIYFKNSLINFEHSSEIIIDYFYKRYKNEKNIKMIYFKNLEMFRKFPNNRKRLVDYLVKILSEEYFKEKGKVSWSQIIKQVITTDTIYLFNFLYHIFDNNLKIVLIKFIINKLKALDPNSKSDDEQFKPLTSLINIAPKKSNLNIYNTTLKDLMDIFK